jgi:hypothetical protein
MTQLPLDPQALAAELSRPLAVRDKRRLDVASVSLRGDQESGSLSLVLTVQAVPVPGATPECWLVTFPMAPEELDPDILPASFVVTIRANLEEWWDTKGADPFTSRLGQRLNTWGDQTSRS